MKMKYVKPALVVETFTLTQSIATGCGVTSDSTLGDPNMWTKATCAWNVGGFTAFLADSPACEGAEQVGENDDFFGVCYNNPNGGATIFGS